MKASVGFDGISLFTLESKKTFVHIGLFHPFQVWGRGEYWHNDLVFDFGLGPFFRIIKFDIKE
jgi:hypothetical protein